LNNDNPLHGKPIRGKSVTLVDTDLFDWFIGEGTSRSTSDAEMFFVDNDIDLPEQDLTLTISGAGDTKTGTVFIKVEC